MHMCLGQEIHAVSPMGYDKFFEKHCLQYFDSAYRTQISSNFYLQFIHLKLATLHVLRTSTLQTRYVTYRKRRDALDDKYITSDGEKFR